MTTRRSNSLTCAAAALCWPLVATRLGADCSRATACHTRPVRLPLLPANGRVAAACFRCSLSCLCPVPSSSMTTATSSPLSRASPIPSPLSAAGAVQPSSARPTVYYFVTPFHYVCPESATSPRLLISYTRAYIQFSSEASTPSYTAHVVPNNQSPLTTSRLACNPPSYTALYLFVCTFSFCSIPSFPTLPRRHAAPFRHQSYCTRLQPFGKKMHPYHLFTPANSFGHLISSASARLEEHSSP